MIDFHKQFRSALVSIGLPVHYEMTLHRGLSVPCISYMETNNYTTASGDTLGYSYITYNVKVWANDIAAIQKYSLLVDKVLRPIGFKRIASGELYDKNSSMIQKIMTFEALASENYD